MKVRLIKERTIQDYMIANAPSRASFILFLQTIKGADWKDLNDIAKLFPRSSIICEGKRIVFRIGGNNYRLICSIKFGKNFVRLYINFIGTHAEYDALNSKELDNHIEHLMILIEAWDRKHLTLPDLNPVEYLKLLMKTQSLKSVDLQKKTGLDKSLISHLLNYRKGFSKKTIKVLASCFGVQQEMFSRDYDLKNALKNTSVKSNSKNRKISVVN